MKNKTMVMFAALLMALSVLGVVHGYWNETLTIEGSVATGELEVEFEAIGITLDSYMTGTATGVGHDKIEVTVENGYPCGSATVTFDIKNTGTIPAKCSAITFVCDPELTAALTGIDEGETIAVGAIKSCTLTIHVEETALETTTYTVTVTIDFTQFNAS